MNHDFLGSTIAAFKKNKLGWGGGGGSGEGACGEEGVVSMHCNHTFIV